MPEDYPRTLVELERRFSADAACRRSLFELRWPKGFRCPRCGQQDCWPISRGLWLCSACRMQVSVLAGSVFQGTHLPLTVWFRAMWNITSQKNGMSALGLQRALGLGSYKTAWLILHKLRQAMVRPGRERLRGVVEVDETYWGAAESGGATGRLIYSKALIVVAAEQDGKSIGRIRMARIPDFFGQRFTALSDRRSNPEAQFAPMGSIPTVRWKATSITGRYSAASRRGPLAPQSP